MVFFIVLTVLSVGLVVYSRTWLRFRAAASASSPPYFSWVRRRGNEFLSKKALGRGYRVLEKWAADHYPGALRWILGTLVTTFLYQAASGFGSALFVPRGMFGFSLLVHVGLGGLFSVSLAATLFWRARDYWFDDGNSAAFEGFASLAFKKLSRTSFRRILFWAFGFFGFVQAATALGSMLPIFTFRAQLAMIMIHRYGALALLLTAIIFADLTFLAPPGKNTGRHHLFPEK
jgi:hypothetical protein